MTEGLITLAILVGGWWVISIVTTPTESKWSDYGLDDSVADKLGSPEEAGLERKPSSVTTVVLYILWGVVVAFFITPLLT